MGKTSKDSESSSLIFLSQLFNEPGPCRWCPFILNEIFPANKKDVFEKIKEWCDYNKIKESLPYSDPHDMSRNFSLFGEGAIIETSSGKYCIRTLFDRNRIRAEYGKIKAGEIFFRRWHLGPLLHDQNHSKDDAKLIAKLKYYWRVLSSIMFRLEKNNDQADLFQCLLTIHKIKSGLAAEGIVSLCKRLDGWLLEKDYLLIPPRSDEPEDIHEYFRAFVSVEVFSICNLLRLCLLNQKSDLDMVVLRQKEDSVEGKQQKEPDSTKQLFGGEWWEQKLNILRKYRSSRNKEDVYLFLHDARSKTKNEVFHLEILKELFCLDAGQAKQMQNKSVATVEQGNKVYRIQRGFVRQLCYGTFMQQKKYLFVPSEICLKMSQIDELQQAYSMNMRIGVFYDSIDEYEQIHSKVEKNLQKSSIKNNFWYEIMAKSSAINAGSSGGVMRPDRKDILPLHKALENDSEKLLNEMIAKEIQCYTGFGRASKRKVARYEKSKNEKIEDFSGKGYKWKIEVFKQARQILKGGFGTMGIKEARENLKKAFADLPQILAVMMRGKVEDLPEHFLRPTKSQSGIRVPKKWYSMPSTKKKHQFQFSNAATYIALSLAIMKFYKSKSIDSEDDILYSKRAITLRLKRLFERLKKERVKKLRQSRGGLPTVPESEFFDMNPLKWRAVMFEPLNDQKGNQLRRKTESGVDDNAIDQEKINSGTDGKKQS